MTPSVSSVNKIFAASYAGGMSFFNRSANRPSGISRAFQPADPIEQSFKAAAAGLAAILKSAKSLKSSAQSLLKPDSSAFSSRKAGTSDKTKATAQAADGASFQSYRIKIGQIASNQVNSGTLLSKSAPSAVGAGANQFKITYGGKSAIVTAHIAAGDTNGQALAKIRDSINNAKTGVTASLVSDNATGKLKLELTSDQTGTKSAFAVTDVSGNAVSATGIGATSKAAADSVYSVNGGADQTSPTNTVELEKGKVIVNLLQPTGTDVRIDVKPDETEILKQAKQMVSDYNRLHDSLIAAGGYVQSAVKRSLESAAGGFESVGIVKKADGSLKLDEDRLKQSLAKQFDRTRDAVSGRFGLAGKLANAAERFEQAPPSSLLKAGTGAFLTLQTYQPALPSYSPIPSGLLYDGLF